MSEGKRRPDCSADSICQDAITLPDPPQAESTPHWEHGYRCHGYWFGLERLGSVGRVYTWRVGDLHGEYKTLRAARQPEVAPAGGAPRRHAKAEGR